MAFSASVRDSAVAEINITPLVDVMLVLLVIFMVSAPMITQPIAATLPQSNPSPRPSPPVLQLEVTGAGAYLLDGRPMDKHELARKLESAVAGDARTILRVRASADADYQAMVTALASAGDSGIVNIGVQP